MTQDVRQVSRGDLEQALDVLEALSTILRLGDRLPPRVVDAMAAQGRVMQQTHILALVEEPKEPADYVHVQNAWAENVDELWRRLRGAFGPDPEFFRES